MKLIAAACNAVLVAAVASLLAACGPAQPPLRLRHEAKRQLVYELEQHEDAPHPIVGLGGSLDCGIRLRLSCISADADGSGQYEATVEQVKVTAPPAAGAAVDTRLGRPVEGDKIGANAVALSLLPRHAIVLMRPIALVEGAQPDLEIGKHLSEWMKAKPVASRKVIYRLAETLDAGPVVLRWFNPVSPLIPPNEHTPHGTTWKASPPPIETPAGRLVPTIDVMYRREGDIAVLEGKGAFAPDGDTKTVRMLDLEASTLEMTARIDLVRGVLVSYDEAGRFDFRLRDNSKTAAPWSHTRKLRLVETIDAAAAK